MIYPLQQFQNLFPQVASGDTVSEDIALIGADLIGLYAPVVDSCQLFLQGNYGSQSSAEFVRLEDPLNFGDWTWPVGPGSSAIVISDPAHAFPFLRIELSAAQTDVRTFALAVKI